MKRKILPILATCLLLCAPAMAHDGVHSSDVTATVTKTLPASDTSIELFVDIVSLGEPRHLHAIHSIGASSVSFETPLSIPEGGATGIGALLQFTNGVPGIFTITLDFGKDGEGPVLVLPN